MSRRRKKTEPQNNNPADMTLLLKADKEAVIAEGGGRGASMYKVLADEHKQEMLIGDISYMVGKLQRRRLLKYPYQVDLNDFEQVQDRCIEYLESCAEAKRYPSVTTLCSIGFGMSSENVDTYLKEHNNQVTEYIKQVKSVIGDIMTNASLYGNADSTSTIFQLKNLHGYADTVKVEAVSHDIDTQIDEKALYEEYAKYDPEFAKSLKDVTPPEEKQDE